MELPLDLWKEVISYLLPPEQMMMSQVNRYFHHQFEDGPRRSNIEKKNILMKELINTIEPIRRDLDTYHIEKANYICYHKDKLWGYSNKSGNLVLLTPSKSPILWALLIRSND